MTGAAAGSMRRETLVLGGGLLLSAAVMAVTTASFAAYTRFEPAWLVWVAAAGFAGVSLLMAAWASLAPQAPAGTRPVAGWLALAIPTAFVLNSQVCGPGVTACSLPCALINLASIAIGGVIGFRLHRARTVGSALPASLIGLALLPHCVCDMNANVHWRAWLGLSPACEVPALAVALFALAAARGVQARVSEAMVVVLLGMIVFMAAGSHLLGFPWQSCIHGMH